MRTALVTGVSGQDGAYLARLLLAKGYAVFGTSRDAHVASCRNLERLKTPFRPGSPYAVAKAAAFWQVTNYREAYRIFACSGILFNHESPIRPERFVTKKITSAARRIARGELRELRLGNVEVQRD